jgi:hypothetical protein
VTTPRRGTAQPDVFGMRSRNGIEHERGIMSESYGPVSTSPDAPELRRSTTGSTSTDATDVKDTAKAEAGRVVDTAKAEAGSVASEAKSQARTLYAQTKGELRDQAGKQQQRVAQGLRSAGDELNSLASGTPSPNAGIATDLVRQASTRVNGMASWLENRDPESLLNEVKYFARRRPGVFIGIALAAGVVAGRLTRALAEGSADRKADMAARSRGTGMGTADLTGRATGMSAAGDTGWTGDGERYGTRTDGLTGSGAGAAGSGYAVTEFDDSPRGPSGTTEWTGAMPEEGTDDDRRNNPL